MQLSRLQKNIEKARQSGTKVLEEEVIYKYKQIKKEYDNNNK